MTTESTASTGDNFSTLLEQLGNQATVQNDLQKAMAEGCAPGKKPNPKNLKKGDDGWEEGMEDATDDSDMMGKAFQVVLADGTKTDAIDATDILKALNGDVSTLRTAVPQMLGLIKQQGDMIKALGADLAALRTQGTGRRSTLTVHERVSTGAAATMAKAEGGAGGEAGISIGEFMLKAENALDAGKITGAEARHINALIIKGQKPEEALVAKILAA